MKKETKEKILAFAIGGLVVTVVIFGTMKFSDQPSKILYLDDVVDVVDWYNSVTAENGTIIFELNVGNEEILFELGDRYPNQNMTLKPEEGNIVSVYHECSMSEWQDYFNSLSNGNFNESYISVTEIYKGYFIQHYYIIEYLKS